MSNNTDLIYGLNQRITEPGSLGVGTIKDEGRIRFVISGAGALNVIRIRARIINQPSWTTLLDITGNDNLSVDVFSWDELEVLCLTYDSTGLYVSVVASSFDSTGMSAISTPGGTVENVDTIYFTSSDNSIDITGDSNTGTIDFSVSPTGIVTSVNTRTGDVVLDSTDVGLGNVNNTSDATKNAAVATLTNKTLTSPVINSPTGLVKADVGLSNVDNTSDANKPVSTAQQDALDLKEDLANKVTDFSTINNTLYPTVQAVQSAINSAISTTPIYMLSGTNSDISGYESAISLGLYTPGALATVSTSVTTAETLLEEFATNIGYPNTTAIPVGLISAHWETTKAAGGGVYYSYFKLYKRTSGGTETLLLISDNSSSVSVNTLQQISLTAFNNNIITLNLTDRLVLKIYARMVSGTANITLGWDDTTDARLQLPGSSITYVPENIANKATDLTSPDNTKYPTTLAVSTAIAAIPAGVTSFNTRTGAVTPQSGDYTKSDVGLSNVDNTSDANKPVSTAQQTALNLKADLASPTFTGTVSGITKSMVGLGNVDNTSDANKPISTATQTALDTKPTKSAGDINETSFSVANNQAAAANVTGLAFAAGTVRGFNVLATVFIDATSDLFEEFQLVGINKSGSFNMSVESVGDTSGIVFSITSAGQIQYTSSNYTGFASGVIKFRAITTTV
jgi:hypothetical protein